MTDPALPHEDATLSPAASTASAPVAFATSADVLALVEVLGTMRSAFDEGPEALNAAIEALSDALEEGDADAANVRDAVHALLDTGTSTHMLTEQGLLSGEGLLEGVLRRAGSRIAPAPARSAALEVALGQWLDRGDAALFEAVEERQAARLVRALSIPDAEGARGELSTAMIILATRIAGDGLDPRLTERMPSLETWQSPFVALSRQVDRYAEAWTEDACHAAACDDTLRAILRCQREVATFRLRKQRLGTTLHLSSSSLRMQQQLRRLDLLVRSTKPLAEGGSRAVATLSLELLASVARRSPVRDFVGEKLGMLSYLVVGHAAQKGGGYAAHTRTELALFARKSLLGGVIVAVFATLKPVLSRADLPPVWQAALYGLNYALCFVLIYLLGATLATKQPAVTASRLAASLEEGPDHEDFARLVRAIWRSQYLSFVGNIVGAASVAVALVAAIHASTGMQLLSVTEAEYLAKSLDVTSSGTVFYAGVAGVMLAFAGLFSGFVDNAVVFHRLGDRVRAGTGVFQLIPVGLRDGTATQLDKRLGSLLGNALLGFLLGSAGTIGFILGLPFDIRHIAFASAHSALALWFAPDLLTAMNVGKLFVAVVTIGLVNFLISFLLTLQVAIRARQVEGIDWRRQIRQLARLLRAEPLSFFLPERERGRSTGASLTPPDQSTVRRNKSEQTQ